MLSFLVGVPQHDISEKYKLHRPARQASGYVFFFSIYVVRFDKYSNL